MNALESPGVARVRLEDRTTKRFPKLKRAEAFPCLSALVGHRCRTSRHGYCSCLDDDGILDHARMWLDGAGRRILTAEPYEIVVTQRRFDALKAVCDRLGLRITTDPHSPWSTGDTILIIIEPA